MQFCYVLDERNCILPAWDYDEKIEPKEEWHFAEIDPNFYFFEIADIPAFKEVDGEIVKRTPEEIQEDIDKLPIPEPTEIERLRADVDFLTMENESLEEKNEQQQADIDFLLMMIEE